MITLHVPAMAARRDVRVVSASISDVPGVRTLRADLAAHTVQVTGPVDPVAVIAAVTAAGYAVAAGGLARGAAPTSVGPGARPGRGSDHVWQARRRDRGAARDRPADRDQP